ncbi:MAG: tRNA lysidine(34) synthetase TilS [Bacteroidales bacterium]|nr:tRNA lysidine(34) synthetase TilS [Bacteroidales bacterium]
MLLVAVSGGVDSMCLAEKVRLEGGPFAIAHCNFGLRGAESDADEAFVRAWASARGIPIHVKQFETQAFASAQGISVEMAARQLRYHWFGQLCQEFGYSAVAVAHNANDNAETLILNLLRGTGLRGIVGMKASGFLPDSDFAHISLLRPLLGMTREDIEAFAREHGLTWREDSSNASNDFKRNKIRNLVFPVFREINPSFVQTLNRDMERFAEEISAGVLSSEPFVASLLVPPTGSAGGPLPLIRPRVAKGSEDNTPSEKEFEVTEEMWDGTQPVKQPEGMLILDADKAGAVVEGRWESGDWIRPLGAPGHKKMQDWFTDHHIPADEKPFVPLLKSEKDPHHVLAVIPYCIDHSVRVTKSTRQILRISTKNS